VPADGQRPFRFPSFVLQVGVNHHGLVVSWIGSFFRDENRQETEGTIDCKLLLKRDLWTFVEWRNGK
jgi:hypothetical protein